MAMQILHYDYENPNTADHYGKLDPSDDYRRVDDYRKLHTIQKRLHGSLDGYEKVHTADDLIIFKK